MKKNKWVVIWTDNVGQPMFMMEDDDKVSLFETELEANSAGWEAPLSVQWPFVVVEIA